MINPSNQRVLQFLFSIFCFADVIDCIKTYPNISHINLLYGRGKVKVMFNGRIVF